MEGLDVVTLDAGSGLIGRVDGFFGEPTPIASGGDSGSDSGSLVPEALRRR